MSYKAVVHHHIISMAGLMTSKGKLLPQSMVIYSGERGLNTEENSAYVRPILIKRLSQAFYPVFRRNEREYPDSETLIDHNDFSFGNHLVVDQEVDRFSCHAV